jgi:hypothetical protein
VHPDAAVHEELEVHPAAVVHVVHEELKVHPTAAVHEETLRADVEVLASDSAIQ